MLIADNLLDYRHEDRNVAGFKRRASIIPGKCWSKTSQRREKLIPKARLRAVVEGACH
jgi:hypothetical protein